MLKQYRIHLLLSSLVTLLPIPLGLLLLPNDWCGRIFAAVIMPLAQLAMHWLCVLLTLWDNRHRNQSHKALRLVFWIVPLLSLYTFAVLYAMACGLEMDREVFLLLFLGLMFLLLGNAMPKMRRNRTMGVKLPWTVNNEENWNVTHRFSGKAWVITGLGMLLCVLLPRKVIPWVLVLLILGNAVTTTLYSWRYFKKQLEAGTASPMEGQFVMGPQSKVITWGVIAVVVVCILATVLLSNTGSIRYEFGEDALLVKASYWEDLTIPYDEIDALQLRDKADPGTRSYGFGTTRLLMGQFRNEEFDGYTRYTYTKCENELVLNVDGTIIVLSTETEEKTLQLYHELIKR